MSFGKYSFVFMALLLVQITLDGGCKFKSEGSDVKHTVGQVSKPKKTPLAKCESKATGPEDSSIKDYIQRLMTQLMKSNPSTFVDALKPEAFCITILGKRDKPQNLRDANASGVTVNGMLYFNLAMVKVMPNDAAFAGIIAHELAHILNAHGERTPDPSFYSPELESLRKQQKDQVAVQSERFTPRREGLKSVYDRIKAVLANSKISAKLSDPAALREIENEMAFNTEYLAAATSEAEIFIYKDELANLQRKYAVAFFQGEPKELTGKEPFQSIFVDWKKLDAELNLIEAKTQSIDDGLAAVIAKLKAEGKYHEDWREVQADEVGYELYLRAGFNPPDYVGFHKEMLKIKDKEDDTLKACEIMLSKGEIPDRGGSDHPKSCWRVYNINFLENEVHKKEYAPLLAKAHTVTMFPGELEKHKAGIR